MKEEFHRIINDNDDLNDAIANMDSKKEAVKIFESQATRRLSDLKNKKKITSTDIDFERNRFEEGYEKHLDKSKEGVNAVLNVQGLSRTDKDIVRRSAVEIRRAIYNNYEVFVEQFNKGLN